MTISIDLATFTRHGGALDSAHAAFPDAPTPWIDLSTGINPVAYPLGDVPLEAMTRLPDAAALAALEAVAASRYGVPFGAGIVAGPGTQAIIQRLPSLCGGPDVRILGPTYGEFERVFAEARVRIAPTLDRLGGADVAIVVNPNNPDGRRVTPDDLAILARRVGLLVVDEAFMDAQPANHSVVPRLTTGRTIVLRSFGKIYGLPGLRLGFAIAPAGRAETLRRMLGPWPVSGQAIVVGTRALADASWLAATRTRLESDGARLQFLLGHVGATPIGHTPLFQLLEHPAATALFVQLARRGILVRPFADAPQRLRFGLPGSEAAWARLEAALLAFR